MSVLSQKSCVPCKGGVPPLSQDAVVALLRQVGGWNASHDHARIEKTYRFSRYPETIAFVNRIADVAEGQNHHPVLHVGFRELTVEIWTHKIDGLTESDFVLAAKLDALVEA